MAGPDGSVVSTPAHPAHMAGMNHMHQAAINMAHAHGLPPHMGMNDVDADPRDLEAFAERFKQRRIKLGVTQADVGSALASLKIPGVGSLSQSTICRFESLTLSHNNMIALKPILQAWLEEAEKSHREKLNKPELFNGAEKKRKRTSIAAPEKRSLEAYFAIQPRPSSEKIAAIAEKLDLKKNVVRVWRTKSLQRSYHPVVQGDEGWPCRPRIFIMCCSWLLYTTTTLRTDPSDGCSNGKWQSPFDIVANRLLLIQY
ncbi:POU domain, class 4, transcription factor 2 [Xenoophorus captivus]|uniref:POU domain protein n=1 Tax=Xenoophorus captivus TaxID=1517983 RepID=A0ABV0Q3Y9_9TELE